MAFWKKLDDDRDVSIEFSNMEIRGKNTRLVWAEKEINGEEGDTQQAHNIFQNVFYKEKRKRKQNFVQEKVFL